MKRCREAQSAPRCCECRIPNSIQACAICRGVGKRPCLDRDAVIRHSETALSLPRRHSAFLAGAPPLCRDALDLTVKRETSHSAVALQSAPQGSTPHEGCWDIQDGGRGALFKFNVLYRTTSRESEIPRNTQPSQIYIAGTEEGWSLNREAGSARTRIG